MTLNSTRRTALPRRSASTARRVQAAAYEGLLSAFYPHAWFNGVYLWLWRADPDAGGASDESYTPQNKPATLEVMARYFK